MYLFGSVAEGDYTLSSDIDVLVITTAEPADLLKELWLAGVKEPFEVHVQPPSMLELYARRGRLIRV